MVDPGNSALVQAVGGQVDVSQVPDEYAWMLHARCRGANPTEFFPSDGLGVEMAQRICTGCPVRVDCLEYALLHRIEHGVWGGTSNASVGASFAAVATSRPRLRSERGRLARQFEHVSVNAPATTS